MNCAEKPITTNIYEEMFKIFIKAKNLNDIIAGIYSLIGNPIAIINNDFQLVAYHSPFLFEDETRNQSIRMGYVNYQTYKKIRESLKVEEDFEIITTLSSNRRLIANIKNENGGFAGFLIILEVETKLEKLTIDFVKILSKLVNKYLSDQNFAKTNDNLNSFLSSILNKTFTDKTIFIQKSKELKIDLRKSFYLLILDFNEQFNEKTKSETENFLKSVLHNCVVATTYHNGDYVVLINNKLEKETIGKINDFLFKMRFYMIRSNRIIDLFSLNNIFEEEFKLFMLLEKSIGEYILYNTESYISLLPLINHKKEELINFVNEEIYKIFLYDEANKTSFIDTIYVYLVTNKSLSESAKKLYLHKNTITYRLEKIKELFNIDFKDFNKIMNYVFSINIIYFLQRKIKNYAI